MTALFVTATGTDIGKTFVTAGLTRHLRGAGRKVSALKPLMTGFDPDTAQVGDAGVLLAALGRPVSREEIARVSPWRYAAPLSPDMAARRERRSVDFAALVEFCRNAIAASADVVLIEGIGGAMVPLDERHTVCDWIAALQVPVLMVTGSYLGSLSHALTALDALDRRAIPVRALVVNETAGSDVSLADTAASLAPFATSIPILTLPRLPVGEFDHPAFGRIAALL